MVSSWLHRHNCRLHRSCARVPMRRCACVRAYVCASRACNVLVTRACVPCAHACVLWCARVCTVRARVCAEDHGMRVRAVHTQDTICRVHAQDMRIARVRHGLAVKVKVKLPSTRRQRRRGGRSGCDAAHTRGSGMRVRAVHAQDMCTRRICASHRACAPCKSKSKASLDPRVGQRRKGADARGSLLLFLHSFRAKI